MIIALKTLPVTEAYVGCELHRQDLNHLERWAAFNQKAFGGAQCTYSFTVPLGRKPRWYCSPLGNSDPRGLYLVEIPED
jgi:hypothetical protein